MGINMDNIRETFAKNLRENRRKCGFTQAVLAEKADVSTHYIALIELARNLPKVEVIERIAKALDIEVFELFLVPNCQILEMKKMQQAIINDLKDIVKDSVEEAFEKEKKSKIVISNDN